MSDKKKKKKKREYKKKGPSAQGKDKNKKSDDSSFLDKKISRRDFLIKGGIALIGAAGLGFGAKYLIGRAYTNRYKTISFTDSMNQSEKTSKIDWKWSREAMHYRKRSRNMVKCELCPNNCTIMPGKKGVCGVRKNHEGRLYSLVWGNPAAVHIDPIEKKPLYHFHPGTSAFSIGFAGCNFECLNCQNSELSQASPEDFLDNYPDFVVSPKILVKNAKKNGCESIAYTYNEPTTFYEYMLECSKEAHKEGLKNVWVTCGFINKKPLLELCKHIDAANVDLKSFSDDVYRKLNSGKLQPVLDTLKTLHEQRVWLEITNLVVPTYTDDEDMIKKMCKWIVDNLGTDYPLHFSRFHPQYKLKHLAMTSIESLRKAKKIAEDTGLRHVYIGNIAEAQETFCPGSDKVCIRRLGYRISKNVVDDNGNCEGCSEKIAGRWK